MNMVDSYFEYEVNVILNMDFEFKYVIDIKEIIVII